MKRLLWWCFLLVCPDPGRNHGAPSPSVPASPVVDSIAYPGQSAHGVGMGIQNEPTSSHGGGNNGTD